jgi:hypothetical protein
MDLGFVWPVLVAVIPLHNNWNNHPFPIASPVWPFPLCRPTAHFYACQACVGHNSAPTNACIVHQPIALLLTTAPTLSRTTQPTSSTPVSGNPLAASWLTQRTTCRISCPRASRMTRLCPRLPHMIVITVSAVAASPAVACAQTQGLPVLTHSLFNRSVRVSDAINCAPLRNCGNY